MTIMNVLSLSQKHFCEIKQKYCNNICITYLPTLRSEIILYYAVSKIMHILNV